MKQIPDELADCMRRLVMHCRLASINPTSLNLTNIRLWATNLEGWIPEIDMGEPIFGIGDTAKEAIEFALDQVQANG